MTIEIIAAYATAIFLLIGTIFTFVAAYGLLKLDDSMTRLHAPTKAGTLGIGSFLLASMCYAFVIAEGSMHELLILAFLFVTAPISANFIAKVHIHKRTCDMPAAPKQDQMWSTFDVPEADKDIVPQTDA